MGVAALAEIAIVDDDTMLRESLERLLDRTSMISTFP
jgi:hypothetical protein